MRKILKEPFTAKMLVEFEDVSVSLGISRWATFADVSQQVEQLGEWYGGSPISVAVRLNAPIDRGHGTLPTRPLIYSSPFN
jgi:hypothetical protein